MLLAGIIVRLAKSIVYSLQWHLSDIQNNYISKNTTQTRAVAS